MKIEYDARIEKLLKEIDSSLVWIAICITVIMLSQCARAETVKATLFRVHEPGEVTDQEYDAVILGVRKQFRTDMNIGLRIRQKHITTTTGYFWDPDLDIAKKALFLEYWRWASWGNARRLWRKRSYGWIVPGARTPQGLVYSWGLANQGCQKKNQHYFVATATSENGIGNNRIDFSSKVIAHELAHTLGARHVGDETLMNTNLGSFYQQDEYIPFSEKSIKQIKECLAK